MEIEKVLVEKGSSLKETMRQIDRNGLGIAFIIDKNKKFLGLVTDGDIRRAILEGKGLDLLIEQIMNQNPAVAYSSWPEETFKEKLAAMESLKGTPKQTIVGIPVLGEDKCVERIAFVSGKGLEKQQIEFCLKLNENRSIKRILVIGGAGYLGSVLARKLLAKGYQVRILDNLTYGDAGIKELYNKPNFEFIKGDMRDLSAVTNSIKEVDAVVHLAAIVGDPASALIPQNTSEINYLAAKMVADVCKFHQVNRFLFASTCSVYGANKSKSDFLHEDSELNEVSLYAKMKSRSEKALLEMRDENFAPTILRLATLYGLSPRMRFDLAVNIITAKAIFDKEITVFGGLQWRPFMHVEDAALAFIKCIEVPLEKAGGKVFNAGTNEQNYQLKEIGEAIHRLAPDARVVTTEVEDERDYRVSFDKMAREFGFRAKKTIEDGFAEIKGAVKAGKITDYKKKEYSTYKFLRENKA